MNHHAKELVRLMSNLEVPPNPLDSARELTTRQLLSLTRERLISDFRDMLQNGYNRTRIAGGRCKRLFR